MELKLAIDIQGNKKEFYKYESITKKLSENVHPSTAGEDHLVTDDTEASEVLNSFFASVFTGKACTQTSARTSSIQEGEG